MVLQPPEEAIGELQAGALGFAGAGEAAQVFSDFLRERYGDLQMPWNSGFGAGVARGGRGEE